MPRYFFSIVGEEGVPDLEGAEMPDLAAARHAAVDIAAEQLKGSGEKFWVEQPWRLEVADDAGAVLMSMTLTAQMAATPGAKKDIKYLQQDLEIIVLNRTETFIDVSVGSLDRLCGGFLLPQGCLRTGRHQPHR